MLSITFQARCFVRLILKIVPSKFYHFIIYLYHNIITLGTIGRLSMETINLSQKDIDRFKSKIEINIHTNCHVFTSSIQRGYGHFGIEGKTFRAHRLAWIIAKGSIPDNLHVLHRCHNPSCVNPDHLYLGTEQNNSADRIIIYRQRKGGLMDDKRMMGIKVTEPFFKSVKIALAERGETMHDAIVSALISYLDLAESSIDELKTGGEKHDNSNISTTGDTRSDETVPS